MRSSVIALASLALLLATQGAAADSYKTAVTATSHDVAAFHKTRPVVTPVGAIRHSNDAPRVPAPPERYGEIPEATPRGHAGHPAFTRPLYPRDPRGTAPRRHHVAS
ncbi:hypothetical protein BGX34_009722 [Mortierella sp. NVP85]|nr:hypothetical protein BGX34_009722 [Mortierella sp. NVP85]